MYNKSCQRSRNILANSLCTSCDEAKKVENPKKKETIQVHEAGMKEIETIYTHWV